MSERSLAQQAAPNQQRGLHNRCFRPLIESLVKKLSNRSTCMDVRPQPPGPISKSASGHGRRLLTLKEAADFLSLSTASLRRLISQGRIPSVRLTRKVLIDLKDLEHVVESAKERLGL